MTGCRAVVHWHRSHLGFWGLFMGTSWEQADLRDGEIDYPRTCSQDVPYNNGCNRERERKDGWDPSMHIRLVKVTGSDEPKMSKKDTHRLTLTCTMRSSRWDAPVQGLLDYKEPPYQEGQRVGFCPQDFHFTGS